MNVDVIKSGLHDKPHECSNTRMSKEQLATIFTVDIKPVKRATVF